MGAVKGTKIITIQCENSVIQGLQTQQLFSHYHKLSPVITLHCIQDKGYYILGDKHKARVAPAFQYCFRLECGSTLIKKHPQCIYMYSVEFLALIGITTKLGVKTFKNIIETSYICTPTMFIHNY